MAAAMERIALKAAAADNVGQLQPPGAILNIGDDLAEGVITDASARLLIGVGAAADPDVAEA